MKKVLVLFAALFMATIANAQISPITFGPKVGYQTTKLSLDKGTIKSEFKGNMTFGVFARLTIKNVIVQPELLYFKSGKVFSVDTGLGDLNLGDLNPDLKFTINQANLALPILVGYQFLDIPLLKARANVGPVFYFAMGKTEIEYPNVLGKEDKTHEVERAESPLKNMTMGAAFNVGIDIWKLTLDVNYSLGLTNAFNDKLELGKYEIKTDDGTKQNIFTVTLGFKLL